MTRVLLFVAVVLVSAVARADVQEIGTELRFFSPATSWKVSIPKEDWAISQEKRRPDGTGFYYMLSSKSRLLQFSIFLDKTNQCSSSEDCRALFWRNPGPMYKDPKEVKQYEKNGFQVIQFYLDGAGGFPVKQANLSAHMYKDGYWLDVHISKVGREVPTPDSMISLLESISVK